MKQWTDNHGADGIRAKFAIYKPRNGLPTKPGFTEYQDRCAVGADGEFVFVLRPETDEAAYEALHTYAMYAEQRAPLLARDIRSQLARIYAGRQHG